MSSIKSLETLWSFGDDKSKAANAGTAKANSARASRIAAFNFNVLTSFYFPPMKIAAYTELQQYRPYPMEYSLCSIQNQNWNNVSKKDAYVSGGLLISEKGC